MGKEYETVIGVEVHVELAARTKIFCGCSTAFGAAPNSQTCPVCLGMPGTLPVLNRRVVELALAVGLALNCTVTRDCRFDRKNYFYPDNPQNYQISQLYLPLCRDGYLQIGPEKKIRIHEIHLEEDAGKLFHDAEENRTLVDYNRAGVPLIEIVSEPDMKNAGEVMDFLDKLRTTISYLGASDCKLQEGSMRVDVNLSVREAGTTELGTRTEMKNLNSFHAIARAIEGESVRQIHVLEQGGQVLLETRRWDDAKGTSHPMRSKEDSRDYRYFPDPDLPPVHVSEAWLREIRERQPELREQKKARYLASFGIPEYDADILTASAHLAKLFEETTALGIPPKKVSNWIMGEGLRLLKEREMDPEEMQITPGQFAALIRMNEDGVITNAVAKETFAAIFDSRLDPVRYVEENGLKTVRDEELLRRTVEEVMASNPKSIQDYRGGKEKALGFLVGQTMKAMKGQADPAAVTALLKELL